MAVQKGAFWLAWSQIPGLGSILVYRIYQHFGDLEVAWDADVAALLEVDGIGLQTALAIAQTRSAFDVEQHFSDHLQQNPNLWTPADADYPRLLLELPDPPSLLYFRGQVEQDENQGIIPAIAIVGTRRPTDYGKRWARRIARTLVNAGFTVVSGLAEGVDAEAHHSVLEQGGRTIAVIGTGVNLIYPSSNRRLAKEIVERGLILSEYPAGTKPDRAHFPRRNRIIAGLSRSVLVIEAPLQSGALITARLATDYNRDVYALPGSLDNPVSEGCLRLIHDGAHMILSEDSLLEMLGAMPHFWNTEVLQDTEMQTPRQVEAKSPAISSNSNHSTSDLRPKRDLQPSPLNSSQRSAARPLPPPSLSPDLAQVLQVISLNPMALDFIVEGASMPTGIVLGALAQLELMGLVTQLPGMLYQRC
ncbi:MAG: DNA-processing protein DprA [Elainellaceae cyanobacterium]